MGPLSAFFHRARCWIRPGWITSGSFDLVLSYFYDPERLFLVNLQAV